MTVASPAHHPAPPLPLPPSLPITKAVYVTVLVSPLQFVLLHVFVLVYRLLPIRKGFR